MNYILCVGVFLLVNSIFIWKYLSRTAYSPVVGILAWSLLAGAVCALAFRLFSNERRAKWASMVLLAACFSVIASALVLIDPLSVNVDRWSALDYFIRALFDGTYPYGVETHIGNHPSPFPLWHYLHIPFYWLGDVGLALFAYLAAFVFTVRWFTRSWIPTFFSLLLLSLSPAYWWEVIVRSDGLGNAMVVFCIIMWMERRQISFCHPKQGPWVACAFICGLVAVTRLSAALPLAIYTFKGFLLASHRRQLLSLLMIMAIVLSFFAPYIFWDTQTWIFFSVNPMMTQTQQGHPLVLLLMIGIELWLVLRYNTTFDRYVSSTACFLFVFFLTAIVNNHFISNAETPWMEDASFDISYLTLAFPYCLFSLARRESGQLWTSQSR